MDLQGLKLSKNKRRDILIKRMMAEFTYNSSKLQIKWIFFVLQGSNNILISKITQTGVFVSENYKPDILKDISHIQFPFLTRLSLSQNNIESVQLLTKLNCPFLAQLDLSQNRLYTTRLFRKFTFTLNKLEIQGNPLRELVGFSEILFDKQIVNLSLQERLGDKNVCEDLRVLLKSQICNIEYLYARNRLAQNYQLENLIKQKIHIKSLY